MDPPPASNGGPSLGTVVFRHRLLVVALTLLSGLAALAFSLTAEKRYKATASIAFTDAAQDLAIAGTPAGSLVTPAQLAASGAKTLERPVVLARVRKSLRVTMTDGALRGAISSSVDAASNLVEVTGESTSPTFAARLADATAAAAVAEANTSARRRYATAAADVQRRLRAVPEGPTNEITRNALAAELSRFQSLSAVARPGQISESAAVPTTPASPKPALNTIVGLLLGGLVGVGAAFGLQMRDRRLRTVSDLAAAFEQPVLGRINERALGDTPLLVSDPDEQTSMVIASFGILRRNVELLDIDRPPRVIAVISAAPEEGKTTVAISLACGFASIGRRTLLVECDLRRPTVATRLSLDSEPGLSDVLVGDATREQVTRRVTRAAGDSADGFGFDCICAGRRVPRPEDLLASKRLGTFLKAAGESYDAVILDTSPVLPVVDTLEILDRVDARLICGRIDQTSRAQADGLRAMLTRLPDVPTGLVVTGLTARQEAELGYDAYTYSYAHSR